MADTSPKSSGIGFGAILFLVFLVLKLTGFISWSWWWVSAPLWVPVALWAGLMVVAGIMYGLAGILEFYDERKKARRNG